MIVRMVCRYRSQISEIESSMKQTWEEKSKLSAQYESERLKLVSAVVISILSITVKPCVCAYC